MNQVLQVILGLAEGVSTPRAVTVAILARHGEWAQLLKLRLREPSTYLDAESYFRDALITEFIRKVGDIDIGVDRKKVALDNFWHSERQCCESNVRLNRFLPRNLFLETADLPVLHFIDEWRKEIRKALPALPTHITPRFSGGATYADSGSLTTTPDKMSSCPTTYANAECLHPFFWETSWGDAVLSRRMVPEQVRGNIFFTVPKDSEKDRGCAKEASIPVSLQLDVARHLRRGLLRYGIDLSSSWRDHREMAQIGSRESTYSTIDLSNASDTVCRVLVELLLPKEWFLLLDSLRAPFTRVEGKWVRLEKFSSMGNGFTFELETLIFASLARTVCRLEGGDPDLVMVFGDDIIVPERHTPSVVSGLRLFGFTPNRGKTFVDGPFRESCGGDFFDGMPVRAYYQKKLPDEPQDWIAMANGLRRVDPDLRYVRRAWLKCLSFIPAQIRRCRGPDLLGDLVIHDNEEHWTFVYEACVNKTHEPRRLFRVYRPVATVLPWHHWKPNVVLACTTLGMLSAGVTPRGGVSGYKLDWVQDPFGSRWLPGG